MLTSSMTQIIIPTLRKRRLASKGDQHCTLTRSSCVFTMHRAICDSHAQDQQCLESAMHSYLTTEEFLRCKA